MLATLAFASQTAYGATFADGFEGYPNGQAWQDGTTHGPWVAEFNGYGTTSIAQDGSNVLSLTPAASRSPGETHAALVRTAQSFGDLDLTVRLRTVEQLRSGTPNPWEVGWVLWHYGDNTHFYYVALKPNGWELGKEDPAYPGAQRFLATGSNPTFPVGRWSTVRIRQVSNAITVWVNGAPVVSFTDTQGPYLSGSLGLYNEDSQVRFDGVTVSAP